MAFVYLGLGSNLPDKYQNLQEAIQTIALEVGDVLNMSSVYLSKPWGFDSNNDFLNAAVLINTDFSPEELLEALLSIEKKLGRNNKTDQHYTDRIIDIDILLYENRIIKNPQLTIPHKYFQYRDFVLAPMAELAPTLIHPVLNKSMSELLQLVENTTVLVSTFD